MWTHQIYAVFTQDILGRSHDRFKNWVTGHGQERRKIRPTLRTRTVSHEKSWILVLYISSSITGVLCGRKRNILRTATQCSVYARPWCQIRIEIYRTVPCVNARPGLGVDLAKTCCVNTSIVKKRQFPYIEQQKSEEVDFLSKYIIIT